MGFVSVLSFAHQLIEKRLQAGEPALDATIGNGNDTLFLAKTVGARGHVYGFDVQQAALDRTRLRLQEASFPSDSYTLFQQSHAQLDQHLPKKCHGRIGAVTFNLGYLPGGDTSIITQKTETLSALKTACKWLRSKGLITIVLYPGHAGGKSEATAVRAWAMHLPQAQFQVLCYQMINQPTTVPYLIAIEKK